MSDGFLRSIFKIIKIAAVLENLCALPVKLMIYEQNSLRECIQEARWVDSVPNA